MARKVLLISIGSLMALVIFVIGGCVSAAQKAAVNPVSCKNLITNQKSAMYRLFWTRRVHKAPGSRGERCSSMANLTVMTTKNAFIARRSSPHQR
jgi:hypothetical protein